MGKLYNSVMVRCTTLLEKFFKRPVDLEFHLLNGANDGLPIEPMAGFWQSWPWRADPKPDGDSNVAHRRSTRQRIDGAVDMTSSQQGSPAARLRPRSGANSFSNLVSGTTRIDLGGMAHY
ncbi:hypothetical protein D8S82_24320 [Mycobacterium hodleri]|uniref:Uncharacterized protein n=1 Tax=Mycolicibacterium hodleri TaxID=49897 RepID=A0A544VVJ9_9MYCO|nr:hypothetical protein [Mycolicibacterium hodleri]TQR84009.1 hypothetical protein D8S82_24320 [Mycolicibacterium hodleri]